MKKKKEKKKKEKKKEEKLYKMEMEMLLDLRAVLVRLLLRGSNDI